MTRDQYRSIITALESTMRILEGSVADLMPEDLQLLRTLAAIRSQVLHAESGDRLSWATFSLLCHVQESGAARDSTSPSRQDAGAIGWAKKIRILIADDHYLVRSGLRDMLSNEEDFEVVAEATNGREAVELAATFRPEIIVMDLDMPVMDGLAATHEALRVNPDTKIIVFSANGESSAVRKSVEAGAVGYLCKPSTRKQILSALRDVHQGKYAFQDVATLAEAAE